MEYTRLGDTGLEVSTVCLGCAGFSYSDPGGWTVGDREQSLGVIERALDAGVNFIDTANIYSAGESEELVGEAIAGRRDEVVLASKVGQGVGDGPNESGLSRKNILDRVEETLDRLGTDYLDVYYAHIWDPETPLDETLSAFDHLVDEGLVRYVGASNLTGWQLMKALKTSDVRDYERYVAVQPEYNLLGRHEELDVLQVARDQGLGVATYSPLAAGFLTGEYDRESTEADLAAGSSETWRDLSAYATDANFEVVDAVRDIADREGVHPVAVAVAWLQQKDVVDAPIVGPQSVEHLETYLQSLEVSLTDEDVARLEAPVEPTLTADSAPYR